MNKTDMRYPGYMQRINPGKWPSTIILVDCWSRSYTEGKSGKEVEQLDQWFAISLDMDRGEYMISQSGTGMVASAFWDWLRMGLDKRRTYWIFSNACSTIWSLLDVWQMIETEKLRLIDVKVKNIACNDSELYRSNGFLICEDPPNILRASLVGTQATIHWVDLRNYGLCRPDHIKSGGFVLDWMRKTIVLMYKSAKLHKLGGLKSTSAAQAIHAFKSDYLNNSIYVHNHPKALELEEKAYIGGRCECFRIGYINESVWHLDFRAMYPSECVGLAVPVRLRRVWDHDHLPNDGRFADGQYGCIAEVTLSTFEPAYPYVRQGEIIYPVGTFKTTLAGPELQDASNNGAIIKTHSLAWYDVSPVLTDYMQSMLLLREKAESAGSVEMVQYAKALGVSLVGKFGQRDRKWVNCPDQWTDLMYGEWLGSDEGGEVCRYRSIAGMVQRSEQRGFVADAVPAIAAWVTSAARVTLLRAIRTAGWKNVYYVDTDSLIVNEAGYTKLVETGWVRDGENGKLQRKAGPVSCEIKGIKYYVEAGKVTCAGLPKGEMQDVGDGLHYWYYHRPSDCIRNGMRPQAERALHQYQRAVSYNHGTINADGSVSPIKIG